MVDIKNKLISLFIKYEYETLAILKVNEWEKRIYVQPYIYDLVISMEKEDKIILTEKVNNLNHIKMNNFIFVRFRMDKILNKIIKYKIRNFKLIKEITTIAEFGFYDYTIEESI